MFRYGFSFWAAALLEVLLLAGTPAVTHVELDGSPGSNGLEGIWAVNHWHRGLPDDSPGRARTCLTNGKSIWVGG